MEWQSSSSSFAWLSVSFLSALLVLLISRTKLFKKSGSGSTARLPPGPPGWPVVGNMFDLGTAPHRNLYNLRSKYGPVLWLRLGSVNTMVIQSAKAAEDFFKNCDLPFSDRKVHDALTALDYDKGSVVFGRYGAHWRTLRRLCALELTIGRRVTETVPLRRKCIDTMIKCIEDASGGSSGEVQLDQFLFVMAFNHIGNLMLSRDLLDVNSREGTEFSEAMNMVMLWAGKPNVADFFPFLKRIDPLRIKRNMEKDMGQCAKIVSGFVEERLRLKQQQQGKVKGTKDFLDALLEYDGDGKEGEHKLSQKNIVILILEMFFAGSETTSSTIEWAMSELLRSPESLEKVREELDRVVGHNREVEESDIENLPYLQAVFKETLRLHPVVPLLIPRNSMEDTHYMGYTIPKDTQVLVNVWAIGRDPDAWENPLSFNPERFIGRNVDYRGQNYELIPFGAGRRICIGYSMGHRVVTLTLARLIHDFDWKPVDDKNYTSGPAMDMEERVGISVRKLIPLRAIPIRRRIIKPCTL